MAAHDIDEDVVRHAFGRLVADEPELGLDPAAAVAAGRRIRRRHRATTVLPAATLGVLALALAVAAVPVLGTGDGDPRPSAPLTSPVAASVPLTDDGRRTIEYSAAKGAGRGDQETIDGRALAYLVFGGEPEQSAVGLRRTDWGSWEAEVVGPRDGEPAAHISLGVTNEPNMLTVHPCQDPEFVAGASCTEKTLADGSYLTRRGLTDHDGVRTLYVSITRDDGTGVFAESTNVVLPEDRRPTPAATVSEEDKRSAPVVVREEPVLSTRQLVAIVRGLDSGEIEVGGFPVD